jgi:hypothetical protein
MNFDHFSTIPPTRPGVYVTEKGGITHWTYVETAVNGQPFFRFTSTQLKICGYVSELGTQYRWKLVHHSEPERLKEICRSMTKPFTTREVSAIYDPAHDEFHQRTWINQRFQLWINQGFVERVTRGVYQVTKADLIA